MRGRMASCRRATIIGGGYIGLEAAATLREAGLEVTVFEAADRVMSRVVSPAVSRFYETEHARHGVEIRCREFSRIPVPGTDDRENFVLGAIGVVPADGLARDAGIACDDGILVDEYCRTSDPHIWAAGDCTRHPSVHYGARVRLESVDNAFEQGTSAALNMLGLTTVHDKVPWFWSDQYDLKMVIVGLAAGFDTAVLRGDPATRAFSVCYLRGGELIAVETVNHTKDQMAARKMIPARARPDPRKLADPSIPLRDC
jgi:3-phenylpropionate/trans-cinnamate dioxygenase ferredoxin reductase subunit